MVLNRIQAHVDGNSPAYVAEFRMRHKDGNYRQMAAHGVAVRDAGGNAVRMAGSHIEMTVKVVKVAEAEVAAPASSTVAQAPETLRRHGLWESWSPIDSSAAEAVPAPSAPTAAPAPASGGALPSINPNALR